jgi:hypothetical protein
VEEKVQLLIVREEIRDLIATYAHRAAQRQSMADLFTDDGAFINRPGATMPPMEVRGRAALDKFFTGQGTQQQQPLPMIHNILISVQGDEARIPSSIEVRIITNGQVVDGSGYYQGFQSWRALQICEIIGREIALITTGRIHYLTREYTLDRTIRSRSLGDTGAISVP